MDGWWRFFHTHSQPCALWTEGPWSKSRTKPTQASSAASMCCHWERSESWETHAADPSIDSSGRMGVGSVHEHLVDSWGLSHSAWYVLSSHGSTNSTLNRQRWPWCIIALQLKCTGPSYESSRHVWLRSACLRSGFQLASYKVSFDSIFQFWSLIGNSLHELVRDGVNGLVFRSFNELASQLMVNLRLTKSYVFMNAISLC